MKQIIALSTTLSLIGCGINTSPGDGEKVGQVVKLSKVGMLSQTWEGELIRGGMNGGSGSFGVKPFDFTVDNDEQARVIKGYIEQQTEVILTYHQSGIYNLFSTESGGAYLISIRPAH